MSSRSTRFRRPANGRPPGSDRNLAYLGLVEVLYGYPIDGAVLTIGCDKTTPACLMAAATVDIPSIALSVGPMISAWADGKRIGSGTVVWKARERFAAGEIDREQFIKPDTDLHASRPRPLHGIPERSGKPPFVARGDDVSGSTFWHGTLLDRVGQ